MINDNELSNKLQEAGYESSSQLDNNFMQIALIVISGSLLILAVILFIVCK